MRVIDLKCWPDYFQAIERGEKPFEVRKNDRGYQKGDVLYLREYDPARLGLESHRYTGNAFHVEVTYLLHGESLGVKDGYCVMGIKMLSAEHVAALEAL